MRQEVEATVVLTYDADAELDKGKLMEQIGTDVNRLLDADSASKVELQRFTVVRVKEEAELYGNETLSNEQQKLS